MNTREKGQTLVQVAMLMIVFMAILAIAIDVGRIYGERRHMQNAADAGALAGARELCLFPKMYGGDWYQAATDYTINRNGAQSADITLTPNEWTVDVVARTVMDTTFARIIGVDTVNVGAEAAAACGSATSACGLWPIAFDEDVWIDLYAGGAGCDTDFFLWTGDNPNNPDPPLCGTEHYCDCFPDNNGDGKCDLGDGDGVDDVIADEGRAYVDFSGALSAEYPDVNYCDQNGCGTSELNCWLLHDSGAMIEIGACIPDLSGERVAVKQEVDSRFGDAINIPLYDTTPPGPCEVAYDSDCTNGRLFYVSNFACIRPIEYLQQYELPPLPPYTKKWKDNMIRVQVNCSNECETNCGSTGGVVPPPWGVWAVSLVK